MKAKTTLPSLGVLAFAGLFVVTPAQACLPLFSAAPGQGACAKAPLQSPPPACPQSAQAGGQSCGMINPELLSAMGEMAAGGMRIATHLAQVLAGELSRYAALADEGR